MVNQNNELREAKMFSSAAEFCDNSLGLSLGATPFKLHKDWFIVDEKILISGAKIIVRDKGKKTQSNLPR